MHENVGDVYIAGLLYLLNHTVLFSAVDLSYEKCSDAALSKHVQEALLHNFRYSGADLGVG